MSPTTLPANVPEALDHTVVRALHQRAVDRPKHPVRKLSDGLFVFVLGLLTATLLGYHAAAEDGGIYMVALAAHLHPSLFAHDRVAGMDWVLGPTRFTLFVPLFSTLLRLTHVPLAAGLLLLQAASTIATVGALLGCARLFCVEEHHARWATLLVSLAAGLPIAGTSLYLLDPYVTARSITTPLLLFAVGAAARRRWGWTALFWLAAAAMHPLMAVWGAPVLLSLHCLQSRQPLRRLAPAALAVLVTLGCLYLRSAPASQLARQIAGTRGYWFLSQWHWYELLGAVLPLTLLWALAPERAWQHAGLLPAGRLPALACACSVTLGLLVAALFARHGGSTMAVARLQPLRTLHLFYPIFLLLVAAMLANACARRMRVILLCAGCIAAALGLTQRALYPASSYLELPWQPTRNAWAQAFVWAGQHTPMEAVFAMDPQYTSLPGEDAQGFRALAMRSVLPDQGKDAGIAAVVPTLDFAWAQGVSAQAGISTETDAQRCAHLLPLGVTWVVLPARSSTALHCPFHNDAAKVCQLVRPTAPAGDGNP